MHAYICVVRPPSFESLSWWGVKAVYNLHEWSAYLKRVLYSVDAGGPFHIQGALLEIDRKLASEIDRVDIRRR